MNIKALNQQDFAICKADVGDSILYPNGEKEIITFKSEDQIDGYVLIQIKTNNIKKNGELGKVTSWLKFRSYQSNNQKQNKTKQNENSIRQAVHRR